MEYGSRLPEPQPEQSASLHHLYHHQYSAPPSLHHQQQQSYFHQPPNPNHNPLPTYEPNPDTAAGLPPADPYALHRAYAYPHTQVGSTPPSYYYGGSAASAAGGVGAEAEPHGFSVKDAIRQYGADPMSYADPPAQGYAPLTGHANVPGPDYAPVAGYADPPMAGYAHPPMAGYGDQTVGYAPAPPRPSRGLAALLQPNRRGQSYLGGMKKGSRKTTKVVQSAYCEVCKIDCTSQEVLNGHKQGKKHKKNLQKLQESITPKPLKAPVAAKSVEAKESQAASKGKAAVTGEKRKRKRKEALPAMEEDLETKKKKILEAGAAPDGVRVCTICNVVVNSQKVYDSHITGQKHITMVKQQQEKTATS
ncbi:putative zinc finger RNA-binding protein [Iris pallida]|uniref:Zinc finger RNA-binding protein n=1 Tax=Iris pallida TaxID=29817 RepID=A0AAX6HH31_IRIPA|nr:putative zinc finger RNA-binding protein [Iris pallida]